MLESVSLRNFQRYRKRTFAFAPGLNVVVGDTGAGKSCLLRSLAWGFLGGPSGGYTKRGTTSCEAAFTLDGVEVRRVKDKEENAYYLGGKRFAAVKTGVPEEVANFLNVLPINVQRQMEAPYLITLPPPDAARALNRVVNLELIDKVLSALDGQLRKARQQDKDSEERLKAAQVAVDSLAWVQEARNDYDGYAVLKTRVDEFRVKTLSLASDVEKASGAVLRLLNAADARQAKNSLGSKARRILELAKQIDDLSTVVNKLQATPRRPDPDAALRIGRLLDQTRRRRGDAAGLAGDIQRLGRAQEQLCRAKKRAQAAAERLAEVRQGQCPLCGRRQP